MRVPNSAAAAMNDLVGILLALSAIVLTSYGFDVVSGRLRIPSALLLIVLGIALRALGDAAGTSVPVIDLLLPTLGSVGIVLIVLEGALELDLSRRSLGLAARAMGSASAGVLATSAAIAAGLHLGLGLEWRAAGIVATPFAIISSAIAIPAARHLAPAERAFVVYESATSDIVGVLLFYALLDGSQGLGPALVGAVGGVVVSGSIGAGLGLLIAVLLGRIKAHVRVVPMIFGLLFVYSLSKLAHLAPLVTVLAVGLLLNNLEPLSRLAVLREVIPRQLETDLAAFKHLTAEFTFVIRTFFFLLLGYSTQAGHLADAEAWMLALAIVLASLLIRWVVLRFARGRVPGALLWYGPKGLISILLFLSIPEGLPVNGFPSSALLLTVLISILLLLPGTLLAHPVRGTERAAGGASGSDA
jgi:potassium/hydrogen antiporter